ncbi:DUF1700 domain-containing protein [Saccharomonospora cyanea]|uniref:Putative membrane protein n=1 Tax=Saccharomonospora cyanea NA-134 TaxID=882082 RepID=H5XNI3_9PSEU|nr:hypothetical protein [Saccharomonospora cyanea]EHR60011.1 putative membrane protein [Saccharomonospora cyanea NA-134]
MSTHTHPVVRAYLARVRTALSDLPEAEIDEIVDDVRPHLAEIVNGLGEDATVEAMTRELGTPESYAAEVRSAGEYPPPPEREGGRVTQPRTAVARLAFWSMLLGCLGAGIAGAVLASGLNEDALFLLLLTLPLVGLSGGYFATYGTSVLRGLPEVRRLASVDRSGEMSRRAVGWLRALNPVWWGVSAALLVVLGVALAVAPDSGGVVGLVTLLLLAGLGVWVGPKSVRDHRLVSVALTLSAFVVGAGAGLADYVIGSARSSDTAYPAPYPYPAADGEPLLFYGSEQVDNIYVFDAEGKPLTDLYFYTEQGSPIRIPRYGCEEHTGERIPTGTDNRFPRPHVEQGGMDDYGTVNGYNAYRPFCEEVDEVPFTVAVPNGK